MAQHARNGRIARRLGLRGRRGPALACAALTVALAGAGTLWASSQGDGFEVERRAAAATYEETASDGKEPQTTGDASQHTEARAPVVVHVDGAVQSPGVYELDGDAPRVGDAVERAGGLRDDADTADINLAAHVADGQKVHIPCIGEDVPESGDATWTQGSGQEGVVNINTATEQELTALPGVGEATAAAIVEERERGGPFASPEDLMRVTGIGQKKYERMRDLIVV